MEAIWQGLLLFMSRFLELRDIDELAVLLVLYHVESGFHGSASKSLLSLWNSGSLGFSSGCSVLRDYFQIEAGAWKCLLFPASVNMDGACGAKCRVHV